MGRSIAGGILRAGVTLPECLIVADRVATVAQTLAHDLAITAAVDNVAACSQADVIIFCVKPKDVAPVLTELAARDALQRRPLLISIAAGISTATIERLVQGDVPVVRAMPNTPCLIGQGMTVVTRGTRATDVHLATAQQIFSTLGRCMTLDEQHFDAVTALSASGPGFIYVVLEALTDGGVRCGLPRHVATELAAQMTLGAADMVLTTGRHPASLKDDVTTPGGCTITGLLTLEDGRVRSVLARTIEATARVAAELGR
jgi:pyrroline-5-carboxylate reductase